MPIPRAYPVRFTPKGIADAFDATDIFPGACRSLQNLVFDQGNPELMTARPGVGTAVTSFAGFTTPGFVSVHITLGTLVYGMIATGRNAGHDEPFCYDLAAGAFITISGVTGANTPTSPATSGGWTPPTMAVIGVKIIVTHPGFNGSGANFFGVIDITNPAAPAWSSANTAAIALPGVPTSVSNFNNRAWYAVGNKVFYSDVLNATTITNAGQSLTLGDTTPITAQSGLPVQTTSAGVVGALIIFKTAQIWQITGDATTNNLAQNYMSLDTGCLAPRSIALTNFGIAFVGIDGPKVINSVGGISALNAELSGPKAADIQTPFQNAVTPNRIAAAFQGNIYRVCLATDTDTGTSTNDYWFDVHRRRWNGPHTFPYDCASTASGPTIGSFFVLSSAAHPGMLIRSLTQPQAGITLVYNDLGSAISTTLTTASLPKTGHMAEKQVIESTIELSSVGSTVTYLITAYDDRGRTVGTASVTTQNTGFLWGSFVWGSGPLWSSPSNTPWTYTVPWTAPVVFKKFVLNIQATATNSLSIGTFYARYQDCGYTNMG